MQEVAARGLLGRSAEPASWQTALNLDQHTDPVWRAIFTDLGLMSMIDLVSPELGGEGAKCFPGGAHWLPSIGERHAQLGCRAARIGPKMHR